MTAQARIVAPGLTALMLGALAYDLLDAGGWHSDRRWFALGSVVLFVAVGWLHARALGRRGSAEAASVLRWWTFVASAFFFALAGLLG